MSDEGERPPRGSTRAHEEPGSSHADLVRTINPRIKNMDTGRLDHDAENKALGVDAEKLAQDRLVLQLGEEAEKDLNAMDEEVAAKLNDVPLPWRKD